MSPGEGCKGAPLLEEELELLLELLPDPLLLLELEEDDEEKNEITRSSTWRPRRSKS
jgi:hypothetical protein